MSALSEQGGRHPHPYWVYVLLSADHRRTYVGITTDVGRRLRQHNGELVGGAKATRACRPWTVGRLHGPYAGRGLASQVEAALKRRRGRRRLEPVDVPPS